MSSTTSAPVVSCHEALRIAHLDAATKYQDLERFRIEIVHDDQGWRVTYHVHENAVGGGPHYLIDSTNGMILWKRYYQ